MRDNVQPSDSQKTRHFTRKPNLCMNWGRVGQAYASLACRRWPWLHDFSLFAAYSRICFLLLSRNAYLLGCAAPRNGRGNTDMHDYLYAQ